MHEKSFSNTYHCSVLAFQSVFNELMKYTPIFLDYFLDYFFDMDVPKMNRKPMPKLYLFFNKTPI